ncbi:NADH dehydrogenase [ubiquinone] 1 alpha subcomplex subunit 9, mitochondrial-like protein [Drosera capensis]
MQALSRRLGQQSFNSAASISSLRPTYSISDAGYGLDYLRYGSTLASRGSGYVLRKGTGGRSSVSGIIATVFGATGFLGRYLVQQLAKMGSQVLVPFRGSEDSTRHLKLMGDLGQIVPMKYNPRDESSIKAAMAKANVVINLIGREYETRNYSFEEVNHHMAEQLALASIILPLIIAKEHGGIMRFVQVSCLGASSTSPSRLLRAKAAAEEAILRELPVATIMRPSTMIGTEDRILNRWAHFARNYSFLPLIGDGSTRIQPVYVVDVAATIVAALKDDGSSMGKIYELGGPEVFTIRELAELMYDTIREYPHYVKVPFPIAKPPSPSPRSATVAYCRCHEIVIGGERGRNTVASGLLRWRLWLIIFWLLLTSRKPVSSQGSCETDEFEGSSRGGRTFGDGRPHGVGTRGGEQRGSCGHSNGDLHCTRCGRSNDIEDLRTRAVIDESREAQGLHHMNASPAVLFTFSNPFPQSVPAPLRIYTRRVKQTIDKIILAASQPLPMALTPDDLPIVFRKRPRTCTLHPIANFVSYHRLIPSFRERGQSCVTCRWIYTVKHNLDRSVARLKTRFVVRRFTQWHDVTSCIQILASPREIFLKKVPFPLPTPNIFNLDEIHVLSQDTLVSENALTFSDLDIVPHKLKGYPVEYLAAYRKGGPQFGSTISEKVSPDAYP